MLRIEGAAALRCWPLDVDLGGRTFRLPGRPAADWMDAVAGGGWEWEVIPGWLDPLHAADLDEMFLSGRLTFTECARVSHAALEAASGMAWWTAVKLIRAAIEQPDALGELLHGGVNLAAAPLGLVVAVLYRIYTRHATPVQRNRLDSELSRPPASAGVTAADRYDPDVAADAWERAAAARGVA